MTIESMFSPSWYRVAGLKPRLRSHTQIHRHHYREKLWYVLQDHSNERYHRFTPSAYYIVAQMNGKRTFQEIWDMAVEHLGDDAPTQDEMIRLAGQLHSSDTLLCDVSPDSFELFQRHKGHEKMKWKQWLLSPLAIRFPLYDPERLLNQIKFLAKPFVSWFGFLLWLCVVGYAVFLAGVHWEGLTENVIDRIMTPENLLLLWLVYPIVKLIHEFGHALAAKIWGGEIHEMGIMLLVFIPVPYVEASCASAFREKRRRMAVDAAGIMVELFLAAVALFVWIYVETGIVHAIAYNVILIGGVSTLLFNGNPLLRFDGYYFLSDALEIPNLGSRSTNYIGYLIQRYVFGSKRAISPASGPGEKGWLLTYGVLSFFYRLFIVATISLFIAQKFFIVGVILAIWAVFTMVVLPLYRKVVFLVRSPQITGHRVRAWVASLAFVLGLSGFIFYVPFPYATRAEGVVWPPENSLVRVSADGFCRSIVSRPNQWVRRGDPIFVNEDPLLSAEKKVLLKRLKELEARYFSLRFTDKTQAAIQKEEMVSVRFQLNRIDEKESQLIVRSPAEGVLIIPRMEDMKDRFLHKGELVAYVVQYPLNTVRVVVPQESIGLVKDQTVRVDVRLSDRVPHIYPAQVRREVPAATDKLPSVALGFAGGGEVAIDPSEEGGTKAFDTIFQLDLDVPDTAQARYIGGRVFVRFDHGKVTLAEQWYRSIRQLLLRRFSI